MPSLDNLPENSVNTTSDRTGKDITSEIEVDKEDVNIYSINDLAPSSAPITIPYMEIYRTNELEYVPYISPYNVGASSDSEDNDSSSSDTDLSSDSDTNNNDVSSNSN